MQHMCGNEESEEAGDEGHARKGNEKDVPRWQEGKKMQGVSWRLVEKAALTAVF